jgi:hypothetical protein
MKLSRDEILDQMARAQWFNDLCRNVGGDIADDLRQHLLLQFCEMDGEKLAGLHERGDLTFYCVRSACNAVRGNNFTQFYKQHMAVSHSLPDNIEQPDSEYTDTTDVMRQATGRVCFKAVADELRRAEWYVRKIWELYSGGMSMRAISIKTGINYVEIQEVINTTKGYIVREYDRLNR